MYFLTAPGYVAAVLFFAVLHAFAAAVPRAHGLGESGHTHSLKWRGSSCHSAAFRLQRSASARQGAASSNRPAWGVPLLTLTVFAIGAMIAELVATRRHPTGLRRTSMWMSATLVVLFTTALVAPSGTDLAPVSVAAVQGGGQQGTSALDVPSIDVTNAHLTASQFIQVGEVDMVLWPENAIDVNRQRFADSTVADLVRAEASRLSVPFVVGVTEDAEFVYDVETGNFVNAQYVVMPDGDVVDRYVKVIKVPFGEYIPFRSLLESLGAPTGLIPKMRSLEPGLLSSTSMALAHLES